MTDDPLDLFKNPGLAEFFEKMGVPEDMQKLMRNQIRSADLAVEAYKISKTPAFLLVTCATLPQVVAFYMGMKVQADKAKSAWSAGPGADMSNNNGENFENLMKAVQERLHTPN